MLLKKCETGNYILNLNGSFAIGNRSEREGKIVSSNTLPVRKLLIS
jgi:hypothetical protein